MNIFKRFFSFGPRYVRQSGFIEQEITPEDYILGDGSPLAPEVRRPDSNWIAYRPAPERQAKKYTFDTMSCVTFSALNCIEYQIEYMLVHMKMPDDAYRFLQENGYLDSNVRINFSDRFTAIMSGTNAEGNTNKKVWDSIRHDGLLPESDLGFSGNSFDEYHYASVITDEMKKKAKEFLKYFDVSYEIVFPAQKSVALTQAPLQAGIPVPAKHSVAVESNAIQFDQYDPFVFDSTKPDRKEEFLFRGIITPKLVPAYPKPRTLKKGAKGDDVKDLQEKLIRLEFLAGVADGDFGPITLIAVLAFQKIKKMTQDGIVGRYTWEEINKAVAALDKDIENIKKWNLLPELEAKAYEFLKRCKASGYSLKITHGLRTVEQQNELYAQGRTKPGKIVTNAKGMKSKHCQGKAFDVAFNGKDPYPTSIKTWNEIGEIGKAVGLKWGGDFSTFKDKPHFEI